MSWCVFFELCWEKSSCLESVLAYLVEAEALLFYLVKGQGPKKLSFFFLSFQLSHSAFLLEAENFEENGRDQCMDLNIIIVLS